MTEISVTQALAELKLLRKRIASALDDAHFITIKRKKFPIDTDRFGVQAVASLQSYTDLLQRYSTLKSRIVQSNATAQVTIAGRTYTVAEAVERKRTIDSETTLLQRMREQYNAVQQEYRDHQAAEQTRIDRLLASELSKGSKTNVDVIRSLTETLLEENKAEIVDPLRLEERIKSLEKDIDEFQTTVDWVLSESNGRTMIVV